MSAAQAALGSPGSFPGRKHAERTFRGASLCFPWVLSFGALLHEGMESPSLQRNREPNPWLGSSESPGGVVGPTGCKLFCVLVKVAPHPPQPSQRSMCKASCLSSVLRQEWNPGDPPLAGVYLW